jgi:hypothetical protein
LAKTNKVDKVVKKAPIQKSATPKKIKLEKVDHKNEAPKNTTGPQALSIKNSKSAPVQVANDKKVVKKAEVKHEPIKKA